MTAASAADSFSLSESAGYRGRFAPSPSGPLHLGSLYCAVFGWLHARHHGGQWLLRIEDIDPPREAPGAREQILRGLELHGLCWDGTSERQFPRIPVYREAVQGLLQKGLAYYCSCSRRQLREQGGHRLDTCINADTAPAEPAAIRFRLQPSNKEFHDLALGWQDATALNTEDFVLWRKDDLPAYQLAVVIDDGWQQISHVVRGHDLLDSTPGQIRLHQALHQQVPQWLHHPLLARGGDKLSKQTGAAPVELSRPGDNLVKILDLLGMAPEPALKNEPPAQILRWAMSRSLPELPKQTALINI